ncbi:MAG: dicarboxylate/amino acid:cation symporter [Armatimonadetes bacterium]|nr:dicarboxylate/amino acid:cation symporter [Armatimonadota bacterium]
MNTASEDPTELSAQALSNEMNTSSIEQQEGNKEPPNPAPPHDGRLTLTNRILLGIVVGIALGFALGEKAVVLKPIGDIFIRLLKMIIAPLILSAIITGVASLGNLVRLGRLGGKALLWYVCTGTLAITNGLILVNLIRPGAGSPLKILGDTTLEQKYVAPNLVNDVLLKIVPENIFQSLANAEVLAIIFFGALLGASLMALGKDGEPLLKVVQCLNAALMKIVMWIMQVAPFGVCALLAALVGETGTQAFLPLLKYIATVMVGLALHCLLLITVLALVGKRNPLAYVRSVSPALATAFGTASSSATLPVTYECLVEKAGISPRVASFFLPISAMVNSDGTAVYEAVAAVFIAQVVGVELSLTQQVVIFITAMAASIGAPGIPSAGLVTMAIVLKAVRLPVAGISLILPVDRLLDQFRTMTNVLGDCVGAALLERSEEKGDSGVMER